MQLDGAAPVLPLLWFLLLSLLTLLSLLLILPLRGKKHLWRVAEQGFFPRAAKLIHDQRAATHSGSVHDIRRLVAQRLVRTLAVVEGEIRGQADHQFAHRGLTFQINVFVF